MMHCSSDMECNRQNFLSFWTIFCSFTPQTTQKIKILKKWKNFWRYYHFMEVYHKWQSYDVLFLRYESWWTELFVILDRFLPFYPHNNPKIQNFEKLKKAYGDIIILHKCTRNHDHMLHCSLDMLHNRFNCYFLFWAIFLPFYFPNSPKNQNLEKMKKMSGDIVILQ